MALTDRLRKLERRVQALEPLPPHKIVICDHNESNEAALTRLGINPDDTTSRIFVKVKDYRKRYEIDKKIKTTS
jgi:hypothetical protein